MTRGYAPIGDYGVIGDLHTVALVGMDGSIDFLCLPSFDSPSVFAALLDAERGGRFQIAPLLDDAARKQLYLPDTNVLLTRFLDDRRRRRGVRLHAGGGRGAGAQPRAAREDGARRGALPDALRRRASTTRARRTPSSGGATPRCSSSAGPAPASWRCGCGRRCRCVSRTAPPSAEFTLRRRRSRRGSSSRWCCARRAVALASSPTTRARPSSRR